MLDAKLRLNACRYIDSWVATAGIDPLREIDFHIDRAFDAYVDHAGLNVEDAMFRTLLSIIDSIEEPLTVVPSN